MKLWILTEERPKRPVIERIISRFGEDRELKVDISQVRIIPMIREHRFSFAYKVLGISVESIEEILLKIVSGESSFVDFLVFMQENEPDRNSVPLYAIEETKTSDAESRNTGVFQRSSKFVFVNFYYPTCKKIMLYNIQIEDDNEPTKTNIFGTRMLMTIGVEILGKDLDTSIFKPFDSIDELVDFKNSMRRAPAGNVQIQIRRSGSRIEVSGRLYKSGSLSHDPNIGALSIIGKTLRVLGWEGEIIVTQHGLSQEHLSSGNKFIRIANQLNMGLAGLALPGSSLPREYWHYETSSEKVATIFLHLALEELPGVEVIYENHAGCERGYFKTMTGDPIAIHKYINNKKSNGVLRIPDSIVCDNRKKHILILEGKTVDRMSEGISELADYDNLESEYIQKYYGTYSVSRHVVLFGGIRGISHRSVTFVLTSNGGMMISEYTPDAIREAINNVLCSNNAGSD
jgi:hypothetical protein